MARRNHRLPWAFLALLFVPLAKAEVRYLSDIKPLLKTRCYGCHGALKQKADLRLDTVAAMKKGGESGPVIAADPSASLLVKRVSATDLAERMPPEHEGEPLTPEQIQRLREWIAQGAPGPADETPEADPKDHWAFRPRVRPKPPVAEERAENSIDAFLGQKHREHGVTPTREASRAILLRRLSFDLIGLPPTEDELAKFEADESPDWYEKAVERLLNDPRHGERWARHWMDIWRYSDWWGLGDQLRNSQKHIWHWRDWIVESLNADTPYDEMIRLMLAADESNPNDLGKLRATGYLARGYFLFNRHQWMDEVVEHVGKGLLGLTLNCAKCHDHKYDPIPQTDYYRMRAFFEPYHARLDVVPGEPDLERDGIPRVFDGHLDAPTYVFIRGQESQPDKSAVMEPGVPAMLALGQEKIEPVSLPEEAWRPESRPWVAAAYLHQARKKLREAEALTSDTAKFSVDEAKAELASVEARLAASRAVWIKSQDAAAMTVEAVKLERAAAVVKARRTLAEAEANLAKASDDKKAALEKEVKTAREALEKTTQAAALPVQPKDSFTPLVGARWTATRFFDSTKDDPTVTFPPTSTGRRSALAKWITDPRNPLTARVAANHIWTRHFGAPLVPDVFDFGRENGTPAHVELMDWLASELVDGGWSMKRLHRLIVTSAAYRMSSSLAGEESNMAKDPDNRWLWRRVPIRLEGEALRDAVLALAGTLDSRMGGPPVPGSHRRGLYFYHSNNERNLFLTTFDAAGVKECYRREQSIVPQQALAMSNSALTLEAAERIAARMDGGQPDDAFLGRTFRAVLGASPTEQEREACRQALAAWGKQQGRAHLVWVLLNHNDFATLR